MCPLCVCAQFSSLQSPEKIQIIKFNIEERAKVEEKKCLVYVPALSDSRTTDSFLGCFGLEVFFQNQEDSKPAVFFTPLPNRLRNSFALPLFYQHLKILIPVFFISSHTFLKNNGRGAQYFAQP